MNIVVSIVTFSSSLASGSRLVSRLLLCMFTVIKDFACFDGLVLTIHS